MPSSQFFTRIFEFGSVVEVGGAIKDAFGGLLHAVQTGGDVAGVA